jgi:hypothetical protein
VADKGKPYNVKAALDDFHSPDSIAAAIRRSGRPVDSTGVAPHIMRRIMRDIPHVPEAATGPFGTARPPLADGVGMQRPQYTPPGQAQRSYPAPSVGADATNVVQRYVAPMQDPLGWLPAAGMTAGGVSSLLTGPAAGLAALPLAGVGGAGGEALRQGLNAKFNPEFAPQSFGESGQRISAAGLEGMGTELFGQPLGAAMGAGMRWTGKRILRGGSGMSEDAAGAATRFGAASTKGGEKKLRTSINLLHAGADRAAREADAAAGGPSVVTSQILQPVFDLMQRESKFNVITDKPAGRLADVLFHGMKKLGYRKATYAELVEIKRRADAIVNYNAMERAEKSASEFVMSNEEQEAAKAVADNLRGILGDLQNKVDVPGVGKGMTLGDIHTLEGHAIEAERAVKATLKRPTQGKVLPYALAGGALYGSHGSLPEAVLAYLATSAATDPAINSRIAMMMQNPALLGALRGAPQNATRAALPFVQQDKPRQQ